MLAYFYVHSIQSIIVIFTFVGSLKHCLTMLIYAIFSFVASLLNFEVILLSAHLPTNPTSFDSTSPLISFLIPIYHVGISMCFALSYSIFIQLFFVTTRLTASFINFMHFSIIIIVIFVLFTVISSSLKLAATTPSYFLLTPSMPIFF